MSSRPFPCLRLPPPLTRCGLSGLMRSCARLMVEAWPVMRVAETVSQNSRPEWDAVSACSPVGKLHPTPIANSGTHFPPSPSTGNCIPFQSQIPGRFFREPDHLESPLQFESSERAALFRCMAIRLSRTGGRWPTAPDGRQPLPRRGPGTCCRRGGRCRGERLNRDVPGPDRATAG